MCLPPGSFGDGFSDSNTGGGMACGATVGIVSAEELDVPSIIPSVTGSSHSDNSRDRSPDALLR